MWSLFSEVEKCEAVAERLSGCEGQRHFAGSLEQFSLLWA
jgi:hypothetical protein